MGHRKSSPLYRGRANDLNLAGRGQYHRPGKRERAEQARHRVLVIKSPTRDISYPCEVPQCSNQTPLRERESWRIKIGHMGPVPNRAYYPGSDKKPMHWIPLVKMVNGCPECWIKLQATPRGFLDDGYDAKKKKSAEEQG